MKKVIGFSVALAAVLFAACDNKENSYNFAQIIYPSGYGSVLCHHFRLVYFRAGQLDACQ